MEKIEIINNIQQLSSADLREAYVFYGNLARGKKTRRYSSHRRIFEALRAEIKRRRGK